MKKTAMTINITSMNEVRMNTRKVWLIKPFDRVQTSKKVYNRKDKSWKKDI